MFVQKDVQNYAEGLKQVAFEVDCEKFHHTDGTEEEIKRQRANLTYF